MSQSECRAPIFSVRWGEKGLGASGVAQDEWEVLMRGDEGGGELELKASSLKASLLTPLRHTPL